ncbi:SPOR domain-containing protein [Chelativorans sp.]|uniref:SPOR domain-containing protein n=1 Tax=Chelativorans sp. TaxID=2203393 RepID=UPI002810E6DC|nr:SPOR domain-containing protein [Chelativorans sp.]
MAESIFKTNFKLDLAQDDPFAELTRIMGDDPRLEAQKRQQQPAEDFAIDLENELLGGAANDLEAHQPTEADLIAWRQALDAVRPQQQAPSDFDSTLDAMLEDALSDQGEAWEASADDAQHVRAADQPLQIEEASWSSQPDLPASDFPAAAAGGELREEGVQSYPAEYEPEGQDEEPLVERAEAHDYSDGAAESETPFDYARALAGRPQLFDEGQSRSDEQAPQPYDSAPSDEAWNWDEELPQEPHQHQVEDWLPQLAASSAVATHHQWQYAEAGQQAEPAGHSLTPFEEDGPPELETVDVPEDTLALADQLDIPEVPYREEVKPAAEFDEIEEMLAGAFGEAAEQPDAAGDLWAETSPANTPPAQQFSLEDDFHLNDFDATAPMAGRPAAAGFADNWDQAEDGPAPSAATRTPAAARLPRMSSRLMMTAAAIGGVVILGGATVFALSFGGDGEPVVLSADASPVKVRPENPGGIQIPNQENPVYKRVTGDQAAANPEQPRLISAAEEPVDLSLPDDDEIASSEEPAPVEENVALAPAEEQGAGTQEAEATGERLVNPMVEESADNGGLAVTPRRVRSFVVRPDGTMVPREIPTPQPAAAETGPAEAAPAEPLQTAAAQDPTSTGTTPAEQGQPQGEPGSLTAPADAARMAGTDAPAAASAENTAPASIPSTGPIPPSRPANLAPAEQPQQVASAPPVQPQRTQQAAQPAQQPTQVAALPSQNGGNAASASSEWSVQISSQPTVEGAQQSYQQLAQRFGNMLQGRGVNIVKAEIEGKGTFYRVRIPSSSKDDAIKLCSQLKASGGTCFVSR